MLIPCFPELLLAIATVGVACMLAIGAGNGGDPNLRVELSLTQSIRFG
jgi:hypothetical protein